MPIYEYECPTCGEVKEIITNQEAVHRCERCDTELTRIVSGIARTPEAWM